jgi:chromosome segregation ATPase
LSRLVWIALVWTWLVLPAVGQPAPAPAGDSLETIANKRTAEWDQLARGVEPKIARMLPCDPRVRSALEEVSRASDARLDAVSRYLQSAEARARADVERARKALAGEQAASQDLDTERQEAAEERAAIDGQLADLDGSVAHKPSLEDARKKLAEIRAKLEERIASLQQEAGSRAELTSTLEQLVAGYEARDKAIAAELTALTAETTRWKEFYATRLARAQTECSITNQDQPRRKKP